MQRARSRLGECHYDLLSNNCEHFCAWCELGEPRSPQVESLTKPIRLLLQAAVTLGQVWTPTEILRELAFSARRTSYGAAALVTTSMRGAQPQPRGGLALWQKQRLAEYVAANLGSCIRPPDLARVAGLSTGHFFRAFLESFGEPPLAYVRRQRMRRCQDLMLSSRASLSAIALDCGMCDQSHLTRVFCRIVGVNPGVWTRRFAQQTASDDATRKAGSSPPVSQRSK